LGSATMRSCFIASMILASNPVLYSFSTPQGLISIGHSFAYPGYCCA
jgi:hypothetical protein